MVPVRVHATAARWAAPARRGIAVVLMPIVLQAGCSAAKKASYSEAVAHVDASGTARVAVAAHDQRKPITSGRESPTFVGRQWSLYHMATVDTASGRPLGDDLTTVLVSSLAAKGFLAIP